MSDYIIFQNRKFIPCSAICTKPLRNKSRVLLCNYRLIPDAISARAAHFTLKMNGIIIFFSEMGRHLVYLGHLIAYVLFKISRKISPETESLHLPHGFVFNKLGSR